MREETPIRDARANAPVVVMDLSRPTEDIHADLRARYPRVVGLWWELDEGDKTGWVYAGDNRILAKLEHATLWRGRGPLPPNAPSSLRHAVECMCHMDCHADSQSGRWHQHEEEPCLAHPDAPMVG
jgi:hypothetical protein